MSAPPAIDPTARTLVAGMGNIFLGDDAFGVRTARALADRPLPAQVEVADIGVRGVHLAYRLLDGYDTLVLVDATARGGPPGTLYVIEHEDDATAVAEAAGAPLDGHRMTPDAVLAHLAALCAGTGSRPPRRILVVGCEPACLDEGMELSEPVSGAVPRAVRLVEELLTAAPDVPPDPTPAGHAAKRGETP